MSDISPTNLLSQLRAMAGAAQAQAQPAPAGAGPGGFAELLTHAIDKVNQSQQQAEALEESFQLGQGNVDLAQVMIASEKAGIEFQMMMQVRNKLLKAYEDVMNLHI